MPHEYKIKESYKYLNLINYNLQWNKNYIIYIDKQRQLAKEAIQTMEDLYLRFEREKGFIRMEVEKEYQK